MKKKRALFCIDSVAYLRHIAPIICRFQDSDVYEVEVLFLGFKDNLRENTIDVLSKKVSNIYNLFANHRRSNLFFQAVLALLLFLNPAHSSPLLINRTSAPFFIKYAIHKLRLLPSLSLFIGVFLTFLVRNLYKLTLYTDPQFYYFRRFLRRNNFSFVFSAPYIFPNSRSVPLQLACKSTSTLLVGQVASWDNLTTKGTWVVKPDQFFVWNKAMTRQLADIHPGINDIASFHGSPTFESNKVYKPTYTRESFLNLLSLSADDKYILYLCSSPSIGGDNEDLVLEKLISSLNSQGILNTNTYLVIRTHPLLNLSDSSIYKNPPPNVLFYPLYCTSPNLSTNANDLYLSTISHSELVIGQNTSAFLDVCLLDRPCITLPEFPGLYDPFKFGHIQLLLDGCFIHRPPNLSELANLIRKILIDRGDSLSERRAQFVKTFLFPDKELPSTAIYRHISILDK